MNPRIVVEPPPLRRAAFGLPPVHPLRILAGFVAVATLLLLGRLLEPPPFVDVIRIDNPTPYDLSVEVATTDAGGWMPLWTATRATTTLAEEIYDVGDTWVLRFSAQGETTGPLRVDRSTLERSGWRLVIPGRIGEELRAEGAMPPP